MDVAERPLALLDDLEGTEDREDGICCATLDWEGLTGDGSSDVRGEDVVLSGTAREAAGRGVVERSRSGALGSIRAAEPCVLVERCEGPICRDEPASARSASCLSEAMAESHALSDKGAVRRRRTRDGSGSNT